MVDWLTDFIETVGYWGIFVLMVLEMFVPIVQSEIVMTFSGFTASRSDSLNFYLVILAGVAGSQVGSVALYWLARLVSEEQINRFLARWGGWLGFNQDNLEKSQDFFRRHDQWAVLLGRLLPGLRGVIAVPAGIQKMPFWRFFVLILVGTTFWVALLTWLGRILGENWRSVDQYSAYITYGFLAALAAFVLYRIAVVTKRHVFD